VVTDLVSTHMLWYSSRVDYCLVPTEAAAERAIQAGLRPGQIRVVGLPVGRAFSGPAGDRRLFRQQLSWPQDLPMVLLVGGGEGMGPIFETARAIAALGDEIGLAVIAGRNQRLHQRLEAETWPVPTFIYGFERRMAHMMRAADVLVTKAGPGTVTEALNANLPMVMYGRLPGQEDGNVRYIEQIGAGVWAPGPERSAQAVQRYLRDGESHRSAVAACQREARPGAAEHIAEVIKGIVEAKVTLDSVSAWSSPAAFNHGEP
jgi:1,2-diacylglycerol 3-beta-galactosyltransferase